MTDFITGVWIGSGFVTVIAAALIAAAAGFRVKKYLRLRNQSGLEVSRNRFCFDIEITDKDSGRKWEDSTEI